MIELNNYFFNDSIKKFLIKWIKGDYKKFLYVFMVIMVSAKLV